MSADPEGAPRPLAQGESKAPPPDRESALVGVVRRVTYHAEDSLYTVVKVIPDRGYGDPDTLFVQDVTAVGHAPEPAEGMRVRMDGEWTRHPTHGKQFRFQALEVLPPRNAKGLVKYLASKAFDGIGETLAKRIVDKLGLEALNRIRDDPACLAGIQGLRPDVAEDLVAAVITQLGTHRLHAFLAGLGFGPAQTGAAVKALGPDCEALVREDPYILGERVPGMGFLTADRAARELGVPMDSPLRMRAALVHALKQASNDGHCALTAPRLVGAALELVKEEVTPDALTAELARLEEEQRVRVDRDLRGEEQALVYLPMLYACETGLAKNVQQLMQRGAARPLADGFKLDEAAQRAGLELHELQREAVLGLLSNPVALLTGGPGVGKTTIVRLVVELAEAAGATIALASPTGRAAKRLAEATGRDASTVHRLLGWDPQRAEFVHGDDQPLVFDLVIVDELSMLDVTIAHHLLKAVQPPSRLVMVGDPNQLPSVQAGNVLADMLDSGAIPTWRLTQIYRQQEGSLIVRNAHRVLAGEPPEFPPLGNKNGDFFFFQEEDEEAARDRLVEVVTERIPKTFGLKWEDDVQVLAPMYKGACGVDELNARLRVALGYGGHELEFKGRVWRVGDRVIHTRNDYEKEVFNGDMGRVVRVNADATGLAVQYPEQEVFYAPDDLSDLSPAFAITVHRSQGGEFPCVVFPLTMRHYVMLQRHLFYTAITRAKQLVVLVGSRRALQAAVDNADQAQRESGLAERLRRLVPRES